MNYGNHWNANIMKSVSNIIFAFYDLIIFHLSVTFHKYTGNNIKISFKEITTMYNSVISIVEKYDLLYSHKIFCTITI